MNTDYQQAIFLVTSAFLALKDQPLDEMLKRGEALHQDRAALSAAKKFVDEMRTIKEKSHESQRVSKSGIGRG